MRVAIATRYPDDIESPNGGVEAVSVSLVRGLVAEPNLEVDVVTFTDNVSHRTLEASENLRIHRLPLPGGSELLASISDCRQQMWSILKEMNSEIVHAHDTYGLMTCSIDIPSVFTVHGFVHKDTMLSNNRFPWVRGQIWKYFEHRGWRNQRNIISISPYVREAVTRVSSARIVDIDNPIHEKFFHTGRKTVGHRVFCAANICYRKNQLALVKATAELIRRGVPIELRLAGGSAEPDYLASLVGEVEALGLQEHVEILGPIGVEQVLNELRSASVFALMSREENSPMGIEEAMAIGIPVVSSNRCGMPYMIEHGRSGYLVDFDNIDDIAARIGSLLIDNERNHSFSIVSKQIASARFHPKKVAEKTAEAYRDILGTYVRC